MSKLRDNQRYASFLRYWLDSLWSWTGLFAYFWLLFGGVDLAQRHFQVGFLETLIAFLYATIAVQRRLMLHMSNNTDELIKSADELFKAVEEHNQKFNKPKKG